MWACPWWLGVAGVPAVATPIRAANISSMLLTDMLRLAEFLLCRIRIAAFLSAKLVSNVLIAVSISQHFRYFVSYI
jgi:hypothetical protein